MAELRRVDGAMEPIRQLGHRKILLPFEQELCQQLALTTEQYFKFLEYTATQNGKRPKEYDNIPRAKKVVLASAVLEGSET